MDASAANGNDDFDPLGRVALYRAGLTLAEIARRQGVTAPAVYKYLAKRGVVMRPYTEVNRDHNRSQNEALAQAYERGCSVPMLADILRVSPQAIYRRLVRQGVEFDRDERQAIARFEREEAAA